MLENAQSSIRNTRILITGGAGFIGSRLTQQLLSSRHECLVVDNLTVGLPAPPPCAHLRFAALDICDRDPLEKACQDFSPETVVHLAAIHHIPTCEKNAPEAFRVNVVGFQVVLDAAEKAGCEKVVLASSGAVYDWQEGPLREDSTPARPSDVYSLSKFTNEQQLRLWAQKTKGSAIAGRIFNTIGANDPNAHLIPDILRQLQCSHANGKTVLKLGNTHTRRDYIYVEDTAACLKRMVEGAIGSGVHVFNIGTGKEFDVASLARMIADMKGMDCEITMNPALVRKVDRQSQLADITRAVSLLGWKPRYSLTEALRLVIQ